MRRPFLKPEKALEEQGAQGKSVRTVSNCLCPEENTGYTYEKRILRREWSLAPAVWYNTKKDMERAKMTITAEQRKKAKGEGFLSHKDGVHFSARVITENGVLTAKQLKNVCEAAEKYGYGQVSFTSRLTLEIPGITYEDMEQVKEHVQKEGLVIGGTGAKVRPVVACKGTVCVFGLIDTQGLATKIHKRFFEGYGDVKLPHKFKIAVGGCPNNCVKPDLNDFGIVGQMPPVFHADDCRGCAKCAVEQGCPMKAARVKDGRLRLDKALCSNCGLCIKRCYFKAMKGETAGYKLYIGGKWGKTMRQGSVLTTVYSEQQVMETLEKAILYFKENAEAGERFGQMVDRIGFEKVKKDLLETDILARKDQILAR